MAATQQQPEPTFFHRVYSIPLVACSIQSINDSLQSNPYTRSPYSTAKDVSLSAFKCTEPLQVRLAPIIVFANNYANKAVDVVQSRYPYPFEAKPEELAQYVRETTQNATLLVKQGRENVHHTVDEKVKYVAENLDTKLAPLVDGFEVAVTVINGKTEPSPESKQQKYQYQRAITLSKNLTESLYHKSNEQLRQLQESSVFIQRATETAHSITSLASSSLHGANVHVHALSNAMLTDLRNAQATLSTEIGEPLAGAIAGLRATLAEEAPLNEKVGKLVKEVKERVSPALDAVACRVKEILSGLAKRGEDALAGAKKTKDENAPKSENAAGGGSNGHA